MSLKSFQTNPETGINIVCLVISAIAPTLAIGPAVGIPTGAAVALGLVAVIKAQKSASKSVRSRYYFGAWMIRIFAGCFEQMAYFDQFAKREELPFEISATNWAWIATLFMAAIDLWAYQATAATTEAKAQQEKKSEAYDKEEKQQKAKEAAETERLTLLADKKTEMQKNKLDSDLRKSTEIERIKAETERKKAEIEAETIKQQSETSRKESEERRKSAEIKAESRQKQAEIEAETKRKQAEENRKEQESRRKEQEDFRKEKEDRRKEQEKRKQHLQEVEQANAERNRMESEKVKEKEEDEKSVRNQWSEASNEDRKDLISKTEIGLTESLGRKPTQKELAEKLGTTDRTMRKFLK